MLLTTFVLLNAFGLILWLLGHYFSFHGVASIGAILVIMVGGAAAISDVTVQSGEQIERQFDTVDNQTVNNESTISYTETPVAVTTTIGAVESYMLGALTMIAGALLLVQNLNEVGG